MYKIGLEYSTIGIVKEKLECNHQRTNWAEHCNICSGKVNGFCRYNDGKMINKKLDPTGIKLHLVEQMEKWINDSREDYQNKRVFISYLSSLRRDKNFEWSGIMANYIKEYHSILGPELLLQVMAEVEYRMNKTCPICKAELEVPSNPADYHPNHICECGRLKRRQKKNIFDGFTFNRNVSPDRLSKEVWRDSFITKEAYDMYNKPIPNMWAVYMKVN